MPAQQDAMQNRADFLEGGGELGALMRGRDWSASLGDPAFWPQSLKTCLRVCLASRQPMWVWWGPDLINFYNDAYLPVIGGRHPHALGQPARQVWHEIWPQIEGRIAATLAGQSSYSEAELLIMERNGYREETYYTFSFSPVPDDDGNIGGILCANTDDTERVVGARRLVLLRDLAAHTWDAATVDDVYRLSAEALSSDPRDMPFALLYRLHSDGKSAVLRGACGMPVGHAAAPAALALDGAGAWPVGEVARLAKPRHVTGLKEKFTGLPTGPWEDAPDEALLLPLSTGADTAARGVMILGLNPYRPKDAGMEDFAHLTARQIASALINVEAFEAEHERARAAEYLALEVEQRRRVEKQQNLLLDELNHRVKNTLSTVQAIALQTLRGVDARARDSFIARLFAMSSQHDLLTLDNWEGASFEGVLRRALAPYRDEAGARLDVEGPPVHLTPKRALALGMAFHELATNAARYGALSNDKGRVHARWTLSDDAKRMHFTWRETGGPPVSAPSAKGFGLRLIEHGVAREISASVKLSYPAEGLICEWDMTL
jgi:two-component sensor histidine kinase